MEDCKIIPKKMARETKGGYHGYQFNPFRVYRLYRIDCSTKHLG